MAKIEVTLSEVRAAANSQVAFMIEQRMANEWYKKMMTLVSTYVNNLQEAAKLYERADSESAAAIKAC